MTAGSFTADISAIRERARQKMREGPVTASYRKDPRSYDRPPADDIIDLLGA